MTESMFDGLAKVVDELPEMDIRLLKTLGIFDYVVEFSTESDRGAAILSICVFEDFLTKLLRWRLGKMGDAYGKDLAPRGRLGVTIKSCGLMHLMSADEMEDARRLVKIRNEFAHKLASRMTFEDAWVKNELNQLKVLPREMPDAHKRKAKIRYLVALYQIQIHAMFRFAALPELDYAAEYSVKGANAWSGLAS